MMRVNRQPTKLSKAEKEQGLSRILINSMYYNYESSHCNK